MKQTQKNKGQPFYEWSKDNTKQVRISTISYNALKKEAKSQNTKMLRLLDKLIKEKYGTNL